MQVKYISVEEKKYPIVINFSVLMEVEEETGRALKDFANFRLKDYLVLFHNALIAGAEEKEEKYSSDISHSKKLLNKCYGEFMEIIPVFFDELLKGSNLTQETTNLKEGQSQIKRTS